LTADSAVFSPADESLEVLLVERGQPPFEGSWATPGGFVEIDEPIPEVMDGRVMTSAFVAGFRKTRTVRREPLAELVDTEHETVTRDDAVEERLEDLGYI
jgi:8-oxo-dGTP pyrophosphatase MutT (NUDIX family)